jgi:hypothetical protein
MHKPLFTAVTVALMLAGQEGSAQGTLVLDGATLAGNISQVQSGSGNSQSISIGGTTVVKHARHKSHRVFSTQSDPDTGNRQSADVSGSGSISQRQSGRNNSQSLVIEGNSGTPSIMQSQTGANRTQSIKINGERIEMSP